MRNPLKRLLKEKPYVLGGFISAAAPVVTEVAAVAGLDFVIVDTEHGASDFEAVIDHIRAAEAHGITAIVRMTELNVKQIGRFLDNGIHGVQIPMIETAEQADLAVRACRFSPLGIRGASNGRGGMWGTIQNYQAFSNDEVMTVCMCETKAAVSNIGEIVKTPNLDTIFVGTGDLGQSLGGNQEALEESVDKILKACLDNGIIPGIVTSTSAEALKYIKQGFRYVTVMNDMVLLRTSLDKIVKDIRNDA